MSDCRSGTKLPHFIFKKCLFFYNKTGQLLSTHLLLDCQSLLLGVVLSQKNVLSRPDAGILRASRHVDVDVVNEAGGRHDETALRRQHPRGERHLQAAGRSKLIARSVSPEAGSDSVIFGRRSVICKT